MNQPGSAFEYGVNLDWAGRLVERLSGLSLDEYCQRHILEPLGMSKTTFFPTQEAKENLAYVHTRHTDGSLGLFEHGHPFRAPLVASTPEEVKATINSGGAGLFSNPREFCKILTMLLNQGKSPNTGNAILKPDTIKGTEDAASPRPKCTKLLSRNVHEPDTRVPRLWERRWCAVQTQPPKLW